MMINHWIECGTPPIFRQTYIMINYSTLYTLAILSYTGNLLKDRTYNQDLEEFRRDIILQEARALFLQSIEKKTVYVCLHALLISFMCFCLKRTVSCLGRRPFGAACNLSY